MIVSRSHRFLLFRNRRTGSTTTHSALTKFAQGPEDLVSRTDYQDQDATPEFRQLHKIDRGRKANLPVTTLWLRTQIGNKRAFVVQRAIGREGWKGWPQLHSHEDLRVVSRLLSRAEWREMPKLAGIREPYDWVVSLFHHRTKSSSLEGFADWIRKVGHNLIRFELLGPSLLGDTFCVDVPIRYEAISEDLDSAALELGLHPLPSEVTKNFVLTRSARPSLDTSVYFGDDSLAVQIVQKALSEVFDIGGYSKFP